MSLRHFCPTPLTRQYRVKANCRLGCKRSQLPLCRAPQKYKPRVRLPILHFGYSTSLIEPCWRCSHGIRHLSSSHGIHQSSFFVGSYWTVCTLVTCQRSSRVISITLRASVTSQSHSCWSTSTTGDTTAIALGTSYEVFPGTTVTRMSEHYVSLWKLKAWTIMPTARVIWEILPFGHHGPGCYTKWLSRGVRSTCPTRSFGSSSTTTSSPLCFVGEQIVRLPSAARAPEHQGSVCTCTGDGDRPQQRAIRRSTSRTLGIS